MKRRLSVLALSALCGAAVLLGPAIAGDASGLSAQDRRDNRSGKNAKAKKERPKRFAVVKVGAEYRVVETGDLKKLKKDLTAQNKQAKRDWAAAKKAAAKAKQRFTEKAPKKVALQIVRKGFKSEEAAVAFRDQKAASGKGKGPRGFLVCDLAGEIKIMPRAAFADYVKQADRNLREATARWSKAKREAAKAKRSFTDARPQKAIAKRLAGPFPTEEKAEAARSKILAKRAADAKRAAAKAAPKPATKTGPNAKK